MSKKRIVIFIAALFLVAAAGVGIFYFFQKFRGTEADMIGKEVDIFPPFYFSQEVNFLGAGGYLVACWQKIAKKFLEVEKCQNLLKKGSIIENIFLKKGENEIITLVADPVMGDPPCEHTPDLDISAWEENITFKKYPVEIINDDKGPEFQNWKKEIINLLSQKKPGAVKMGLMVEELAAVDLNSDGQKELVFSASTGEIPKTYLDPGEEPSDFYSVVGLVSRQANGEKKIFIIQDSILQAVEEEESLEEPVERPFAYKYFLEGFGDLDEDGVLEVILHKQGWEDDEYQAYYFPEGDFSKPKEVGYNGCGV